MFSHWQGRLDPRVMILGRTGRLGGKGDGRDRGHGLREGGTLLHLGAVDTPLKDRQRVGTKTHVMKVTMLNL